jgi:phosphoglycolate phosphatase-like HAD superfamily hydrolase
MARRGLVIFDLDGTLFNGVNATVAAVQRSFQEMGLQQPSTKDIQVHIGRPAHEFHGWVGSHCSAEQASHLVAAVDRYELDLISEKGELYPDVSAVLTTIRTLVSQMAICTNGPQTYAKRIIEVNDLARFFDHIRYWQSEEDTKTSMVGELLDKLHARPGFIIGDRRHDIEAARHNGLMAIAATYGYGAMDELKDADVAAYSPADLPGIVKNALWGTD